MKPVGDRIVVQGLGSVTLLDYMGSDSEICDAARVSYGAGTKRVRDDRQLIRYLIRKGHKSPFEMAELKFLIECPMDVWRQWIRHRTANVSEYSTRYSEAILETTTAANSGGWRTLQNSELTEDDILFLNNAERDLQELAKKVYKQRLEYGVVREQARKDLVLCTRTRLYWKMDLNNLMNFLRLRLASDAQYEIRQFAIAISLVVKELFPWTWEAFQCFVLNAITLSADEIAIMTGKMGMDVLSKNEQAEYLSKMARIGHAQS